MGLLADEHVLETAARTHNTNIIIMHTNNIIIIDLQMRFLIISCDMVSIRDFSLLPKKVSTFDI